MTTTTAAAVFPQDKIFRSKRYSSNLNKFLEKAEEIDGPNELVVCC